MLNTTKDEFAKIVDQDEKGSRWNLQCLLLLQVLIVVTCFRDFPPGQTETMMHVYSQNGLLDA